MGVCRSYEKSARCRMAEERSRGKRGWGARRTRLVAHRSAGGVTLGARAYARFGHGDHSRRREEWRGGEEFSRRGFITDCSAFRGDVTCWEKATATLTALYHFGTSSPHQGAVARPSRNRASCRTASFEVRAVPRLHPAAGRLGDPRPPAKPAPMCRRFPRPAMRSRPPRERRRDPRKAVRDATRLCRRAVPHIQRRSLQSSHPGLPEGCCRPPAVALLGTRPREKGTSENILFRSTRAPSRRRRSKANH